MSKTPLTNRAHNTPRDEPNKYIRKGYVLYRPAFSDSERTRGLIAWVVLNDGREVSLWRHPETVRLYEAKGPITTGTTWTGVNAWAKAVEAHILSEESTNAD